MAARIRRYLHFLVADFLYYSGALAVWRFFRTGVLGKDQTCILGLHRVLSEAELAGSHSLPGILMKEATFASLLEYVNKHFRMVSLEELQKTTQNGRRPCCAITFDDGWEDNYTRAYPWIRKYAVPATIFLATGLVGGDDPFWVERLAAAWSDPVTRRKIESCVAGMLKTGQITPSLDGVIEHFKRMSGRQRDQFLSPLLSNDQCVRRSYSGDRMLNWDEVIEMSHAGVEFGSHTVTHTLLPYEDDATVEREICEAKLVMEEILKKKVRAFAYPNGDWNPSVRERVAAAGFHCAFTTQHGWYQRGQDPYTIRRILVHEGNVTGRNGKFSPAMFTLTLARSA